MIKYRFIIAKKMKWKRKHDFRIVPMKMFSSQLNRTHFYVGTKLLYCQKRFVETAGMFSYEDHKSDISSRKKL